MATSTLRRAAGTKASPARKHRSADESIVIYVAGSLDGTSFALDPASRDRLRDAFPSVQVSTRRVFISHDNGDKGVGPFEDPVAALLTGVPGEQLLERFGAISFRDPKTEQEVGRLQAVRLRKAQGG